ncbi:hypothetical protein CRG98_008671 [Punica granatum]|uniref:Uncharacterized protein n=1 Tax=Punica granatum TaxID=22663 RepID=A0A2I0KR09_PUNGR|nr:hypothetical protein CRG98_008671 [Punica granatum]
MPSPSKGPSRPSLFPVTRWSRAESRLTVHHRHFYRFLFVFSGKSTRSFRTKLDKLVQQPLGSRKHPCQVREATRNRSCKLIFPTARSSLFWTASLQPSLPTLKPLPILFPCIPRLGITSLRLRKVDFGVKEITTARESQREFSVNSSRELAETSCGLPKPQMVSSALK